MLKVFCKFSLIFNTNENVKGVKERKPALTDSGTRRGEYSLIVRNHRNPIVYKVACNVSVQKCFPGGVKAFNARGVHQSPK